MPNVYLIVPYFAREPLIPWSSGLTYIMFAALLIAVISGTWAGAIAVRKNRNSRTWFIIGFFLPLIALIIIYMLPALSDNRETGRGGD